MDTRPEFQVGPRSAPLAANDTYTVPGTGSVGQCEIPDGATGLVLNVTALGATDPTFLTVFPAGEPLPVASHLNPAPGQPPSPNAVTTNLGAGRQFSVYNLAGTVHVLADVVGYYTDHDHDDRYYTQAESDAAYITQVAADASYLTQAAADAAYITPAQADAAYVAAPVDHVTIPIASFSRQQSQSSGSAGWEFSQAFWEHLEATVPTEACLIAPVGAPEGAVVTSVDVSYLSQGGPAPVRVTIIGVIGAAGPFVAQTDVLKYHYYFNDDLPATAADAIGRVNLPHDAGPLAIAGITRSPILDELTSPAMMLCAETELSLINVRVNFDMP